jgi:hypothetical protein
MDAANKTHSLSPAEWGDRSKSCLKQPMSP